MIYFIGNKEMNVCKIGFSERPFRRINTLRKQVLYSLDVFDIIEGTMEDEKNIHGIYSEHRIKGEWYHLDKIKETGIRKDTKKIEIDGLPFYYNPNNGFINISILCKALNNERAKNRQSMVSFLNYQKSNEIFLSSFEINPIKKDYHTWVHPFVAIDFTRNSSPKIKMSVYQNLKKLDCVVKLAEQKAKES